MKTKLTLLRMFCVIAMLVIVSSNVTPSTLYSQQPPLEQGIPTNQIIIKYRISRLTPMAQAREAAQMARLSAQAGVALTYFRPMSGDAHVLQLPRRMPIAEVERIAAQLSTLPEVEYAEPDYIMQPLLIPNDPQYNSQWHYHEPYGINLPQAWNITTGDANTVVAVIDTGWL